MVPIFEEVKRLRDEGLGLDSIRRVIGAPAPKPALVARFVPEEVAEVLEQAPAPAQVDMATFASALEHQNRLAMQLARLAHLNGQLQAQLKHLGAEVPRLQRQAAEVPKLKAQLAENPNDLQGWLILGQAYAKMGRNTDAADALRHAVASTRTMSKFRACSARRWSPPMTGWCRKRR